MNTQSDLPGKKYIMMCPKCESAYVEKVHTGFIGGEIFITLKCLNCGHVDVLDEYQLEDWYC